MQFFLTKRQENIIIGNILGDGYLDKNPHGSTALEVKQSSDKREYVFWLYKELKTISRRLPRQREDNHQWRFYTRYLEGLTRFRTHFYKERKIIPHDIKRILTNPISLAVWYMDDGMLDFRPKNHYAFRLSVNCFSLQEVKLLVETLKENFQVEARIHTPLCRGKRYPIIYIGAEGRENFLSAVKPYIQPCFSYKLPPL